MKAVALASLAACTSPPHPQPTGEHYTYSIDHLYIPRTTSDALMYGIDLDGNGDIDNQLGQVFGWTESMGFLGAEPTQTDVTGGQIAITLDLQTPNFASTDAAGIELSTMPGYVLAGWATDGTFDLGPGELTLPFAFIDPSFVIELPLLDARVVFNSVTDSGIANGVIAGGATQHVLDEDVFPIVQQAFAAVLARDCGHPIQTRCGCYTNGGGETLISEFDTPPGDCMISLSEIVNNSFLGALLSPDIHDGDNRLVSIGVGFSAIRGGL